MTQTHGAARREGGLRHDQSFGPPGPSVALKGALGIS